MTPATTAATPPRDAEPVAPPSRLVRGELYRVQLSPDDEAAARARVVEQVAAEDPLAATTVQAFSGALRLLSDDGAELVIKPYVRVAKRLRFLPDARKFVGSLAIGIADLDPTQRSRKLSAPLLFEVLETGQQVSVQQLGPPYALIEISTGAAAHPPIIHIAASFTAEHLAATATFVPTLRVEFDHPTLESLGVQTATVTVAAVGGPTVPSGVVSFSAPGAVLDQDRLDFDSLGRAHTRLRAVLPGRINVAATARGYDAGERSLQIVWPWHATISALLGSLLGAAIRMNARPRRGITAIRLLYGLVGAAVIGQVVFGLYGLLGLLSLLTPLHLAARVADLVACAATTVAGWIAVGVLPGLDAISD
jgi:hypothetical protein